MNNGDKTQLMLHMLKRGKLPTKKNQNKLGQRKKNIKPKHWQDCISKTKQLWKSPYEGNKTPRQTGLENLGYKNKKHLEQSIIEQLLSLILLEKTDHVRQII